MKIRWAPIWNVPLQRRLDLMAAGLQMFYMLFGQTVSWIIIYQLLFNGHMILKTLCILYLMFVYYDRSCGDNGGRGIGSKWVRSWSWWRFCLNYFPINMVKTVDLPANRNYILAVFPHGILCTGVFCNVSSSYSKWGELFPGIRPKLTTLNYHLLVPFFREILLFLGVATSSIRSLTILLNQSNDSAHPSNKDGYTSNATVIIVGGAQEAIHARPRNYTLNLKKRKGFIRMALITGTAIVPVFSFGEVDIFDQVSSAPNSLWRRYQEGFKKRTGILPVLINGRGLFQYNFGLIPRRRPITTVVGSPIEVSKNENPTIEEIDQLHEQFCKELTVLFETHKPKYIEDHESVELFID